MRCECGEPIEPGQKFCIGCGKELGDSSPSDKTAVLPPIVPDEPVPSPQPKKKRSWHKVVIAIVVVIALILAGVLGFVWLWPKDSTPAADKDTVHYSDTKASKVHRKTVIVLYGKDGKPLEKYELKVKDEDGKVTSHSVKDGQFTPESIGMKPDKQYSVVVSGDPDNTYNLPKINVRPDNEAADDIHDNKLDVKPSEGKDSAGETPAACTKKAMYLSYYDVISSLQKKYGEGEIVTDSGARAGYLHGLSVVLLIDSDGDGEEDELITVYDNEKGKTGEDQMGWRYRPEGWTVQAWNYDSEKGKASSVYEGKPAFNQGGQVLLELASNKNGEVMLVGAELMIRSETDLAGYTDYTNYLLSPIGLKFGNDSALVSGEDTLSQTQETIETIKQGMMTDCNVSSDASKGEDSDKKRTLESAFLNKISELQKKYGVGKVVSVGMNGDSEDSDIVYMTGLCDVRLIDFDQDGTDELVVVYANNAENYLNNAEEERSYNPANWTVEIWQYVTAKGSLKKVYSAEPAAEEPYYDMISLTYSSGGDRAPQILGRATPKGDDEPPTVIVSFDGGLGQREYRTERTKESDGLYSFKYYIDDDEVDSSTYMSQVSSLVRADPNGENSENAYKRDVLAWCGSSLPFTKNDIRGKAVLEQAQNTIEELKKKV